MISGRSGRIRIYDPCVGPHGHIQENIFRHQRTSSRFNAFFAQMHTTLEARGPNCITRSQLLLKEIGVVPKSRDQKLLPRYARQESY